MARRTITIDFFGEDLGHAEFFRALVMQLCSDLGEPEPDIIERSAAGGKGKAKSELRAYLRLKGDFYADFLAVLVDANSVGEADQRRDIRKILESSGVAQFAVGCPDPEIESWLLADPAALTRALGGPVEIRGQGDPKERLRDALSRAGIAHGASLTSLAYDVVPELDLGRLPKTCPSFDRFVSELRAAIKRATD